MVDTRVASLSSPVPSTAAVKQRPPRREKEVLQLRKRNGKLEYLVAWTGGYLPSWEPRDNIQNRQLLIDFDRLLGGKSISMATAAVH